MVEYEVTFVVGLLTEEQEQWIGAELDGFVGGHGETTLATVSRCADNGTAAARELLGLLLDQGVHAIRVYDDLVTRGQIAARAGVTPQAVGLWVRRERHSRHAFPQPHVLAGGGLWRWAEVNEWLKAKGFTGDEVSYLSFHEVSEVNAALTAQPAIA